ncbi:MAG: transcriptional regulator [Actinomycetia bacterium]|jgi:DNA-binding GntR family transcriptional regulator|nr:transcriptional regulator [Actinomycetes bacterium]
MPRTIQPVSLAEKAYHAIRELIVSLELAPGAVIEERELMGRLGIGRTPVREALRRLAHERLVEVYPRRGMFVTGVDVRELARLSEVRVVLEPEAARLAAERATDADRAAIGELLEELGAGGRDDRELMELDERIHGAVYRAAHNDLLEATLSQYYVLALRIWSMALDQAHELEEAVEAHRALLEAIQNGDGQRAAETMRAHVQNFEQAMHRVLLTV